MLALALSVAACSSAKHKKLKPVKLEAIHAQVKVKTLWSRKLPALGKYYHQFHLAIDGGAIYASSADGKVFKFDKYQGKKQWRVSLKTPLTTGVLVDSRHVYVASDAGVLIALDKMTGEQTWSFQADSEIVNIPASDNQTVVLQTSAGTVFALDAAEGKEHWQQATNVPALSLRGTASPVIFANYVIIGVANGRINMFDLQSGELRWDPRIALAKGDSEIERVVDIDGTPLLVDDKLYVVTYQGQLAAFDMIQGQMMWTQDESSYNDLAQGFAQIYVSAADAQVSAYNQRTGDIKWSQDGLLRRKITAPTALNNYVLVADYKGVIHLLSQTDGQFAARVTVGGKGVKTNILADGARFYVLANNGRLKAYELGKTLK